MTESSHRFDAPQPIAVPEGQGLDRAVVDRSMVDRQGRTHTGSGVEGAPDLATFPTPGGREDLPAPEGGAAQALARARATAKAKGLRPGRSAGPSRLGRANDAAKDREQDRGQDPDSARDPLLVGNVAGRVMTNRGWETELAVGKVMGRWPAIVGLEVARHCVPERFDRGVLTVRAESTAWAAQLRTFSATMLELVDHHVGPGMVLELRIVGPGGPSWRRGRLRVRGRGPRDTYG